jgi:2-phosphosulfolactate phosphatase
MIVSALVEPCSLATVEGRDLSRSCCVVFDVLRATTTMVTGLERGVLGFEPVLTVAEAEARRREGVILGGERGGERIEGFDAGNSPLEYDVHRGKHVVMTTTNGTRALRAVAGAGRVYAAGVVNLGATVESVRESGFGEVLLVCAGTGEGLALEDVWAAGRLAERLAGVSRGDGVQAAMLVSRGFRDALSALEASTNGRVLLGKGRRAEVEWAARVDVIQGVAVMEDGVVRRFGG